MNGVSTHGFVFREEPDIQTTMLEDRLFFMYVFIYGYWVQKVLCKYTSSNDCSQICA